MQKTPTQQTSNGQREINNDFKNIKAFCCQKTKKIIELDESWQIVTASYQITELLGEGSFGKVVKATHRKTGQTVAIKGIREATYNEYEAVKLLREVHINRKLASFRKNQYSVKLLDIIVPPPREDDEESPAVGGSQS